MQHIFSLPNTVIDLADGDTVVAIPNVATIDPFLNFLYSAYGLDSNDADVQLQGSINNTFWSDIGSAVTPATSTTAAILFFTLTDVIVTGDIIDFLRDNPHYYVLGATTPENDGRKTASTYALEGYLTYNNLTVSTFQVGETIVGGTSGATAVITAVGNGRLTYNTLAVSTFQDLEEITGEVSGAKADVVSDTPDSATRIVGLFLAENGAGDVQVGEQYQQIVNAETNPYAYLRLKISVNSVTEGKLELTGLGKNYYQL